MHLPLCLGWSSWLAWPTECVVSDVLVFPRLSHKKYFSFCLDLLDTSLLRYCHWEIQAMQRSHVWGFQVTASVALPTDSQHQLAALWVRHLGYPVKSSLQMTAASARTSSITCKAQCKMKILGSLFKMYLENQDGNNRTLNKAWGPSKNGVLCDCTGHNHEAHPGASRLWLQPVERS